MISKLLCRVLGHKWDRWKAKLYRFPAASIKFDHRDCLRCGAKGNKNIEVLPGKKVKSDGKRSI
jgi:hypothetical protein